MEKNHRHPGKDGGGKRSLNIVWSNAKLIRPVAPINNADAWNALTARLLIAQAKAGTLNAEILVALLFSVGLAL